MQCLLFILLCATRGIRVPLLAPGSFDGVWQQEAQQPLTGRLGQAWELLFLNQLLSLFFWQIQFITLECVISH